MSLHFIMYQAVHIHVCGLRVVTKTHYNRFIFPFSLLLFLEGGRQSPKIWQRLSDVQKQQKKVEETLAIRSLSLNYARSGGRVPFLVFWGGGCGIRGKHRAAQQLLEEGERDRSRLMSYGTAPRGGCAVLMTVQSLAFGGYMLGAAELWFEVHMQRLTDRQLSVSQSDSQSANVSTEITIHLYLLKAYNGA